MRPWRASKSNIFRIIIIIIIIITTSLIQGSACLITDHRVGGSIPDISTILNVD